MNNAVPNTTKVDNLNHPMALNIRTLLTRPGKQARAEFLIDDEENILAALKAKINLTNIFTTDINKLSENFTRNLPSSITVQEIAIRTAKKIFGNEKVSRTFAIAQLPKSIELNTFSHLKQDLIILDKLSITGNIGAIIRTAAALNVAGIVILDTDYIDIYDRRIVRSSRGYIFHTPIVAVSTSEFIEFIKNSQYKILATSPYAQENIDKLTVEKNQLAIIFGGEKEGCSEDLLKIADLQVKIPINPEVESLNVSAAAGIILYMRNLYYRTL